MTFDVWQRKQEFVAGTAANITQGHAQRSLGLVDTHAERERGTERDGLRPTRRGRSQGAREYKSSRHQTDIESSRHKAKDLPHFVNPSLAASCRHA
jgi:hypothetical protein